ncbi:MAG: membrane protein of unknown function [Promethearchaeota archaeon]|nr:MAG: membrane protein of unknown function [Candidatus Lokiarchaeota archaeon]
MSTINVSRISTKQILLYSLGFVYIALSVHVWSNLTSLLFMEGSSVLYLSFASLSFFLILCLAPVFGILSDNTRSSDGRRRPWIQVTVSIGLVLLVLSWVVNLFPYEIVIPLFIILVVGYLLSTILNINTRSLFSEMFLRVEERLKANAILQTVIIIANFALFFASFTHITFIYDNIVLLMIFGISISTVGIITGILFAKSGFQEDEIFLTDAKVPVKESIKLVLKDRDFLLLIGLNVLLSLSFDYISNIISAPLNSPTLEPPGEFLASIFVFIRPLTTIIFIFFWRHLSKTRDIKHNLKMGIIFLIFSTLPLSFLSPFLVIPLWILNAIGRAAFLLYNFVFISSIIDSNEIETKSRRDGTFFGVLIFLGIITLLINTLFQLFTTMFYNPPIFDPDFEYTLLSFFGTQYFVYFIVAIVFLLLSLMLLKRFNYNTEKIKEVEDKVIEIHNQKREELNKS